MTIQKIIFSCIFILSAISAMAQRSDLDSNKKVATVYMDSIKHYKLTKQKQNLRATKIAFKKFKKKTRYTYNHPFGFHVAYTQQRIALKKHSLLTPLRAHSLSGLRFGAQIRLNKEFMIGFGFNIMTNADKVPSTTLGIAENRAGDSLRIIPVHTRIINNTNLSAPYIHLVYKTPINDVLTFESLLRLSLNRIKAKTNTSYLLVSSTSNYNEIVTAPELNFNSITFQPGVGLGVKFTDNIKLVTQIHYNINSLQSSFKNINANFITITKSTDQLSFYEKIELPKIKNGLGGSIGLRVYLSSRIYAHEKNYTNPKYYNSIYY